jgi:hypothetical protein
MYLRETLWRTDRLLLVVGSVGLVLGLVRRVRPTREIRSSRDVVVAVWIWLAASVLILIIHSPLFVQHFTVVVTPAAVLAARHRPPRVALVAISAVLLAGHGAGASWRLSQPRLSSEEYEMVEMLHNIVPNDGLVISDEPALGWLANRTSPGALVDPSYVRIAAGQLTTAEVAAAALQPRVCAVLFWSGRFDGLAGLRTSLLGYEPVFKDGRRELLLRPGCHLSSAGPASDAPATRE